MIIISDKNDILTLETHFLTVDKILPDTNRFYPKNIVDAAINKLLSRIEKRELCGEIFCPKNTSPQRQLTVLYKQVSHIIIGVKWKDDQLIGTIETTSTASGELLRNMIINKIPTAFKLRSYGSTKTEYKYVPMSGSKKYELVTSPLHIVTWDVSNQLLKE